MSYLPRLQRRPPGCPVPLTVVQNWYWKEITKPGSDTSLLRVPAVFLRASGPLSTGSLTDGIHQLVSRHEALRTRIAYVNKHPQQLISTPAVCDIQTLDLSHRKSDDRENIVKTLASEFLAQPFDINSGSVFETKLVRLTPCDHVLMIVANHLVSDAISWSIMTRDLLTIIGGETPPEELPQLEIQFPDYAVWQEMTSQIWKTSHEPYWRNRLSHFPRLAIPRDHVPPSDVRTVSHALYVPFGKRLTADLREAAKRERCMLPLLMLSLYLSVMSRWCERSDLIVNFLFNGRHGHPEFRNMVGCLAHSAFLRVEMNPKEPLRDILGRVVAEFQGALTHDASRVFGTDLIPVDSTELYFNWLPAGWGFSGTYPAEQSRGDIRIRRYPVSKPMAVKFAPFFMDTPSGILLATWYDDNEFTKQTVERFAAQIRAVANIFVHDPNAALSSLDYSA